MQVHILNLFFLGYQTQLEENLFLFFFKKKINLQEYEHDILQADEILARRSKNWRCGTRSEPSRVSGQCEGKRERRILGGHRLLQNPSTGGIGPQSMVEERLLQVANKAEYPGQVDGNEDVHSHLSFQREWGDIRSS